MWGGVACRGAVWRAACGRAGRAKVEAALELQLSEQRALVEAARVEGEAARLAAAKATATAEALITEVKTD